MHALSRSHAQILDEGVEQEDRTGTGTLSLFGAQMRFDLSQGFPLVTTKKLHLRSIIVELLWFLRGDTNVALAAGARGQHLGRVGRRDGDLGPVYGKQWRDWEAPDGRHIDQIAELIDLIRKDPALRRQIVTAWNPAEIGGWRWRLPLPVPDPGRGRAGSTSSSTSAAPTCSWACRSTSPAMRC